MKPATNSATAEPEKKPIVVHVCGNDNTQPAEDFKMCPLGLQFYSCKPLREFDLFEFNLDLDQAKARKRSVPVKCTGAVVRCEQEKENNRYRVWIQFLDLPKSARGKLECVCKAGKHLCSYCENF